MLDQKSRGSAGPLSGIRVVEIAGLGPAPFASMMLAEMGADVVRIERPGAEPFIVQENDFLNRGRGFIVLDLKTKEGNERAQALIEKADILIEGMRPGVMERLGLGPETFENSNPKLIYGRMTGWGQHGPLSRSAGHDINYIALTGALHAIGAENQPVPPLNLVGDFGGGALYFVFGLACALHETRISGKGQVVDASIVDGVSHLMCMIHSLNNSSNWNNRRQSNLLDGGAPFYTVYVCADGKYISVGALEPQFYNELLTRLGLDARNLPDQMSQENWPELHEVLQTSFLRKSRDEWSRHFEGSDACVSPVLTIEEAKLHRHMVARGIFQRVNGEIQPSPAPRLSRTPGAVRHQEECQLEIERVLELWSKDP